MLLLPFRDPVPTSLLHIDTSQLIITYVKEKGLSKKTYVINVIHVPTQPQQSDIIWLCVKHAGSIRQIYLFNL